MQRSTKTIVALTTKEVLLRLAEFQARSLVATDPSGFYRGVFRSFLRNRAVDRRRFRQKLGYLRKYGYIRDYVEGKERYAELTAKGKARIHASWVKWRMKEERPRWDGRWRIVIFDVPQKQRLKRDALRRQLTFFGFVVLQKSVYVFPYDCKDVVDLVVGNADLRGHVQYIIADIIEGEEQMIAAFIDRGVLASSQIARLHGGTRVGS